MSDFFTVELIQELVLALGIALAGANLFALLTSGRRRRRFEADLAEWKATKKGERGEKPTEPQQVRKTAAIVNVGVGLFIALVAVASLTFDWVR